MFRRGLHVTSLTKDAEDCLAQLREAVEQRKAALEALGGLAALGREANRKGDKLRVEMGEQFDPVEWNRQQSALPEEQEIARLHAGAKEANARVLKLRKQLHPLLDPRRSQKTTELFAALDSVPWDAREESTDRYIRLADSILSLSKRPRRAGTKNLKSAKAKERIRSLWIELQRPPSRDFCTRLDAKRIPIPDSVEWRTYATWSIAFKKSHGAVAKWLSETLHPKE